MRATAPCHRPLEPAPGNAGGGRDARDTRRAIVLAGGDPVEPSLRSTPARRRGGHRGRLGPAPGRAARSARRLRRRRPRLGRPGRGRTGPGRRARSSNAIPPDKDATDLELAFDLAPRAAGVATDHRRRRRGRAARSLPRERRCCSRRPGSPTSRSTRGSATRTSVVAQGGRPRARDRRDRGLTGHAAPGRAATAERHHDHRSAVPAARARPCAPGTSRGVSNVLVGAPGSVVLEHGTLLVVQAFGGRHYVRRDAAVHRRSSRSSLAARRA